MTSVPSFQTVHALTITSPSRNVSTTAPSKHPILNHAIHVLRLESRSKCWNWRRHRSQCLHVCSHPILYRQKQNQCPPKDFQSSECGKRTANPAKWEAAVAQTRTNRAVRPHRDVRPIRPRHGLQAQHDWVRELENSQSLHFVKDR